MIIYKVTNLVNNKIYIGATIRSLKKRRIEQISSSTYFDSPLYLAICKYGKGNFKWEVIEIEPNKKTMYNREQYYIAFYDSMNNGYNMTTGGINCIYSKETKKKISKSNIGEKGYWYGKKFSKEHKRKMSDAKRGEKHPLYGRCGELNPFYGKHHSEETKKKMSIAIKKAYQKRKFIKE